MTIAENSRGSTTAVCTSTALEADSLWRLLRLLPALRSGRHNIWDEIRTLDADEVEIRTPRRPRSVNTDGEIVTRTPAHFRLYGAPRSASSST